MSDSIERVTDDDRAQLDGARRKVQRADALAQQAKAELTILMLDLAEQYGLQDRDGIRPDGTIARADSTKGLGQKD